MFHEESFSHTRASIEKTESSEKASAEAVQIAGEGNYVTIIETLRERNLLDKEKNRVEHDYALREIPFLNEHDREMFTVLDLYDPATARHCLETYRIARGKIEKEIIPGVSFARLLERHEEVTPDQFYRACLFHDIGKVEVPRAVIRHRMDEGHMLECMHHVFHMLYHDGKIPAWLGLKEDATDHEIDDAFTKQHSLRCIHLVAARETLSPEELAEVKRFGYSGEETLMDIIKKHEARSGRILQESGYPVEAQLAALHHNYEHETPEHPLAVSVLHMSVDLADMLHIADIAQALSAERSYKKAFSMPKVMRIIAEHAQEGKVSLLAAYLWLTDEMHEYETTPVTTEDTAAREKDAAHLVIVHNFIAQAAEQLGTISV